MNHTSSKVTNSRLRIVQGLVAAPLPLLTVVDARASECQFAIDGNDQMQFSQRQLGVPTNYDGFGRSAGDNNTLFGFLWVAL